MNERIFYQIQNDNTAYWLGFLTADGSIHYNKLEIGLSLKDKEHLEKFKEFIDYQGKITERNTLCTTNKKYYPSCYITIRNEKLIQDLAQYKIIPNKSHQNIDFLNYIPEQYKIPFILGLFDGDGWFTNTDKTQNFGICGNELVINSIANYLTKYFSWDKINTHQYSKSIITFYFQSQSKNKMLDFIKLYLSYKNKCDLLLRKKNIALDIKNKILNFIQSQEIKNEKIKIKKQYRDNCYQICPICNKQFQARIGQIYCSQECVHKSQQIVERPSRDKLKQLIRNKPFLQIGKQYGVNDNTIRKWCKSMSLPYQKKVINSYSDKEWDKI